MNRFWIRLVASLPLTDTVVLVQNGRVVAKRGRIRTALLSELAELVRCNQIQTACVMARTTASTFRLSFLGVPDETLRQRFRNVWGVNWR